MTETPSTAVTVQPHYAAVSMSSFGSGGALPALKSLSDVVSIAQLMAKSGVAVPKHLRENPGACLGVTLQALDWGVQPFAAANKSYSVNDRLAYEAQMLAAVILKNVQRKGMPRYLYVGEGAERTCTVEITMPDDEVVSYTSPKFKDITPKNSPLWKSDPDQQQGYYAIRSWARRHRPDVILGAYDRDEIAGVEDITDVTPRTSGIMGRLGGATETSNGFQADNVTNGTAEETPHDPETGEVIEVEVHDIVPEDGDDAGEAQNDAPLAEEDKPTPASVTDASTGSAEATSEGLADGERIIRSAGQALDIAKADAAGDDLTDELPWWEVEEPSPGTAAPGETYRMVGDVPDDKGKVPTYKDGARFSSVGEKGAGDLDVYEVHAPNPGTTSAQDKAATEQAATAPQVAQEAPSGFIGSLRPLTEWPQIKSCWVEMIKADEWKAADPEDQEEAKRAVWAEVERVDGNAIELVTQDPTAFVIWAGTQVGKGSDDIKSALAKLKGSAKYQGMKPEVTERFETAAVALIQRAEA